LERKARSFLKSSLRWLVVPGAKALESNVGSKLMEDLSIERLKALGVAQISVQRRKACRWLLRCMLNKMRAL